MNGYVQQLKVSLDRQTLLYAVLGVLGAAGVGATIARWDIRGAALLLVIPVAIAMVAVCLYKPKIGFLIYLQLCFVINGINRFTPFQAPFGLMADAMLFLLLFGILLNSRQMDWGNLHNVVFYLLLLWTFYTILELFNPEAVYPAAWFFAVRMESIYWMQLTVLTLVLIRTRKDINQIVNLWLIWSVIAAFWAFKQRYLGVTAGEQRWLDEGAGITHILFGRLRCFSFYSDAGQFGVEMAYATLLCMIRVLEEKSVRQKLFFLLIGLILFWGYAVSGTRGALFVILSGFPVYLLLRRNLIIITVGILIGSTLFGLLKYTSVGSDVYEIGRMRTALNPEDNSLQVRLDNQKKLFDYLSPRPFGCGIGSSGDWAKRFAPGSFLAETPPDSWFIKIWTETGMVGLVMHVGMLLFFMGLGAYKTMRLRDPVMQSLMLSLLCGYAGVIVASYGNPVFGQFPTNSIMSISIVLLCSDHISKRHVLHPADEPAAPQHA